MDEVQISSKMQIYEKEKKEEKLNNSEYLECQERGYFSPALHIQRKMFVADCLRGVKNLENILFVGCGTGNVLQYIINDGYTVLCGVDKSQESIEQAVVMCQPLLFHYLTPIDPMLKIILRVCDVCKMKKQKEWLRNFEAIVCTEVIEHIEKREIEKFLEFMFIHVQPKIIIITTPNKEFNRWWWTKESEWRIKVRDDDHKFEFTQNEFKSFCGMLEKKFKKYKVREITGVGEWKFAGENNRLKFGYSTQIAVFTYIDQNNYQFNKTIDETGAFEVIDYPREENKRSLKERIVDEVFYMYNLIVNFYDEYAKNDFIPLQLIFGKIKIKKEFENKITYEKFIKAIDEFMKRKSDLKYDDGKENIKVVAKLSRDKSGLDEVKSFGGEEFIEESFSNSSFEEIKMKTNKIGPEITEAYTEDDFLNDDMDEDNDKK